MEEFTVAKLAAILNSDAMEIEQEIEQGRFGKVRLDPEEGHILGFQNIADRFGCRKATRIFCETLTMGLSRNSTQGVTFYEWREIVSAMQMFNTVNPEFNREEPSSFFDFIEIEKLETKMSSVPDESRDTPPWPERERLSVQELGDLEGFKRKLIEFCEGRLLGIESDRTSDGVYAAIPEIYRRIVRAAKVSV